MYEFTSSTCPAQDTDESPWEDAASTTNTNTAHAEAEWTRLSSDFQNVRTVVVISPAERASTPIIYIHTQAGYREGITAGKEDALQEGFDAGFAQAGASRGRELGLLRGLASAFLLPLSRPQAQAPVTRTRTQDQTESEGHDDREEEEAANTAAPLLPAIREILAALTSVRFADIAPPPPPEEAEHVRGHVHGAEEGKSEGWDGEEGEEGGRGLSSSTGPKATTIEDVRALRVRLEALLRQAGLNVDLNLESLDP